MNGEWMRWWRKGWGVTTEQMAAKFGVTRMTVHRWEHDTTPIPEHVAAWMQAHMPRLPWPPPGTVLPEIAMEPATPEEMAEMVEMERLIGWRKPRKRTAAAL